jgi:nitroreductase/NAD-dependent dihydropyrimidine dehydrogenase PreA subunit
MEMNMPDIVVNQTTCSRCGACVALCTGPVYKRLDERIEAVTPDECWLCGHCIAVCPADAIRHSAFPMDECPIVDTFAPPSLDELVAAFRERRSLRAFRDKPVPHEVVQELVDISRWVPSASNKQPVDWLAIDDPARIAALSAQAIAVFARTAQLVRNPLVHLGRRLKLGAEKAAQELERAESLERMAQEYARGEDPIFFHAPVVLVAHVPADDYFGRDDAIYATYNLMLAAARMGLGTCQIGYFIRALSLSRELGRALGLPEGRRVEVVLTLGYPQYRFRRAVPRRQPELTWGGR